MVEGVKEARRQTNVVPRARQAHWLFLFDGGRSRAHVGLRRATFETSDVRGAGHGGRGKGGGAADAERRCAVHLHRDEL